MFPWTFPVPTWSTGIVILLTIFTMLYNMAPLSPEVSLVLSHKWAQTSSYQSWRGGCSPERNLAKIQLLFGPHSLWFFGFSRFWTQLPGQKGACSLSCHTCWLTHTNSLTSFFFSSLNSSWMAIYINLQDLKGLLELFLWSVSNAHHPGTLHNVQCNPGVPNPITVTCRRSCAGLQAHEGKAGLASL